MTPISTTILIWFTILASFHPTTWLKALVLSLRKTFLPLMYLPFRLLSRVTVLKKIGGRRINSNLVLCKFCSTGTEKRKCLKVTICEHLTTGWRLIRPICMLENTLLLLKLTSGMRLRTETPSTRKFALTFSALKRTLISRWWISD